ncbi:hypothetical protein AAG906_012537 [Vitis piasezkii]
MEHLLAPRDFFYPRIATDFYQSMTTKEHARLLKPCKFLLSQPNSIILELGKILLSWRCTLLYSREGSQKKSQRADCIPLLFPRLLCQILDKCWPQAQQAAILRQLQVHFDLPQVRAFHIYSTSHTLNLRVSSSELEAPADAPTEEADPSA